MIVCKKRKIILITPPKTGTHSITKYFTNNGIYNSLPIHKVNHPIYHLTLSEICKIYDICTEALIDFKIIQCVRNPYDRMVSAWLHQNRILNKNLSFYELLCMVEEIKHLLPNDIDQFYYSFYKDVNYKDKSFINGHWGGLRFYFEQNWFNDVNANINYFKLENLKNSTIDLSTFLGIKLENFPHINKNTKRNMDYNSYYDDTKKDMVTKMYKNDINLFSYEF